MTRFAFTGPAAGGDLFGIWEAAPAPEAVSFDAAAPAVPTWRVALPASPDEAQALLEARIREMTHSTQDLAQAQTRLAHVDLSAALVSFAVPGAMTQEDRLREALGAARAAGEMSFAAEAPELAAERRSWQDHLAQVQDMLAHAAYVETEIAEALIGRTAVSWDGDFRTTWQAGASAESMRLHQQSLHLAMVWRMALIRLAMVVGRGAVRLAASAGISGVLALPAAWRFVQDVLDELRRLRAVQREQNQERKRS